MVISIAFIFLNSQGENGLEDSGLYFDHMLKSGDAYQLARDIRRGLDLIDAEGSP